MSNEVSEDQKDIQEILKEKESSKNSGEELSTWNPGLGLTKEKSKNDVHGEVW